MKKAVILAVAVIIEAAVICSVMFYQRNRNPFKNVSANNIQEVTICNPAESKVLTQGDDITLVLNTLKEMKLVKKQSNEKEGFAFVIYMKLKNGKKMDTTILSKDIIINNQYYKPDKDYCDVVREIYDKLPKE